ncbi:hypothetical protein B566_EDAN011432 [Ephemera danica]|nr:hypothetical protein B566_EDAN011432 [Ephemera danica]
MGSRVVTGGRGRDTGKTATLMTVTLSYDRRAIDEEQAADFLAALRDILSNPTRMILGGIASATRARVVTMAAAIRLRLGNISQRFLPTFLSPNYKIKIRLNNGFHHSSSLFVVGTEIKMPSLSPTMAEGTIVKWLKKEGDTVQPGDVLCDIQTDKAVVSFEIEEEGILAKILVPEDTKDIKIGTLIGLMVGEGENWREVEIPASTSAPQASSPAASSGTEAAKPQTGGAHTEVVGPAVHRLLEQFGLAAKDVPHSGPKGNILKGDIINLVAQKGLQPQPPQKVAPPAGAKPTAAASPAVSTPTKAAAGSRAVPVRRGGSKYVDLEVTGMRRTIAKRLSESKTTIPHSYGNIECDISEILRLRKALKADGIAVSVNDFVIKAVAVALRQCPSVNCIWTGDKAVPASEIDISIAVATENGLITPIVKGAGGKGVHEISTTVRDLATRAKQGKLQLNEFQGGTFTISNLGMFGIGHFSAIINPPQCGILAVGSGRVVLVGKPRL